MKQILFISIFLFLCFKSFGINSLRSEFYSAENEIDSLKYNFCFSINQDLSDTYNGGQLLSGEILISRNWYGAALQFGQFQSTSNMEYKVLIEDIDKTISIPYSENTNMKLYSFSLLAVPIAEKWFTTEVELGLSFASAKSLILRNMEYSYNIGEDKFIYLYRDYMLVEKNHFGYHVDLNLKFRIFESLALKLKSSLQDLNNGGSFIFIGSGIDFSF